MKLSGLRFLRGRPVNHAKAKRKPVPVQQEPAISWMNLTPDGSSPSREAPPIPDRATENPPAQPVVETTVEPEQPENPESATKATDDPERPVQQEAVCIPGRLLVEQSYIYNEVDGFVRWSSSAKAETPQPTQPAYNPLLDW